jgi:anti-sigma factor RsiW
MLSASLHLPRCGETAARLSEFLDGDLDEAARHEVSLHLALCSACAQLAADLAATIHALHGLRSGSDPPRDPGAHGAC